MSHKWNEQRRLVLLEEYAKHKKEFLCNDVKKDKIWKEIYDEVRMKCYLDCSPSDCCDEIKELRLRYETDKSRSVTNSKVAIFLYHAKRAFEIIENSEEDKQNQTVKEEKIDPPSEACPVTPAVPVTHSSSTFIHSNASSLEDRKISFSAAKMPSYIPLQQCNWKRRDINKLLNTYKKYKEELPCSGVEKLNVWNKIAAEVIRKSFKFYCDGFQCSKKIEELRSIYERIKKQGLRDRKIANFFNRAKAVFENETTDNLDNFSARRPNTRKLINSKRKKKRYRLKLLQVYAKHRTPFLPASMEELSVWEKIAKEMREIFFHNWDESLCRLCRCDLLKLQQRYYSYKNAPSTNKKVPYFLQEAQQAFETTHNLDSSQTEVGNCNDNSIFPHSNKIKHEDEQNSSTSYKDSRQTEVGNCNDNSIFPHSNKRKHEDEQNSSRSYKEVKSETVSLERRLWYLGGEFASGF